MENKTNNSGTQQQHTPLHKCYCSDCGAMISANAVTCPHCGAAVNRSSKQDEANVGLKVLSFFMPMVGLILYIMCYQDTPNAAKEYGKWAAIGFAVSLVLIIVYYITIYMSFIATMGSISSFFS